MYSFLKQILRRHFWGQESNKSKNLYILQDDNLDYIKMLILTKNHIESIQKLEKAVNVKRIHLLSLLRVKSHIVRALVSNQCLTFPKTQQQHIPLLGQKLEVYLVCGQHTNARVHQSLPMDPLANLALCPYYFICTMQTKAELLRGFDDLRHGQELELCPVQMKRLANGLWKCCYYCYWERGWSWEGLGWSQKDQESRSYLSTLLFATFQTGILLYTKNQLGSP